MLAVVTCHWNPAGWESLRRNYARFRHEMLWWNIPTFAVELAYDGQQFASKPRLGTNIQTWRLQAGDQHRLWQKERLINYVVERLPEQYDQVAWIDADVLFLDHRWPSRVTQLLEQHPVVQLWDQWHCTDHAGRVGEVLKSVGRNAERYGGGKASPGGAWAARRSVFPIYDRHIVGSGDAMCLEAWIGQRDSTCMKRSTPAMREHYAAWAVTASEKVQGDIGVLPGHAVHLYHGSRASRQYVDRWKPVIEAGYDPATHVTVDGSGLLAWTDAAPPALREWVSQYFSTRREDDDDDGDVQPVAFVPPKNLPVVGGPFDGQEFPESTHERICISPAVPQGYQWYGRHADRWEYVGASDTAERPW